MSIGLDVKYDLEDLNKLRALRWHLKRANGNVVYVASSKWRGKTIYMHRFIMNCPKDKVVHHVNGDGLDNRKINLEKVDKSTNKTSGGYKR